MLKVALVSSIRPETNYTAYLIDALQKHHSFTETLVYTDREPENLKVGLRNVRLVWNRDWPFVFQIIAQAVKDRVNVLHFQHEINMYGGPRTAVLFPILVLVARIFRFNPVVTFHAAVPIKSLDVNFLKVFSWPYPRLLAPLVRIVFPLIYFSSGFFAKRVIAHSQGLKEILVRDYHIGSGKITVIPHGVPEDVSYDPLMVSPNIKKFGESKFILYFGYFHRRKGLEFLIRAFKEVSQTHPDLVLVLAGGTIIEHYLKEVEDLIVSMNLQEKVKITGFVRLPDLRFLLENSEFIVLPAVYSIAASGPLAQVFAHEKAVIGSDLGVYREEIVNNFNGLLAKAADAEDLRDKIITLIENPQLVKTISENVAGVKKERSWSTVAGQTIKVYLETREGRFPF